MKAVYNITKNEKYKSIADAERAYNQKPGHSRLGRVCSGKGQTFAGCQWCLYEQDMEYWDIDQFMFIWD